MAVRSAMHQAGAAALTELLPFPAPAADQRTVVCPCGHPAHYRELRSQPVLTAVGRVEVSRPYYLCSHCHTGPFPADVELDIEKAGVLNRAANSSYRRSGVPSGIRTRVTAVKFYSKV